MTFRSSAGNYYALTAAATLLLLARGRGASAACSGDVSTFTGDACDYESFVSGLSRDCTLEELGELATDSNIQLLCDYDAPVRFMEIQGTYQLDRRYFAGGGPMVDGNTRGVESKVKRFETNVASGDSSTLISWPEYAARVKYNKARGYGDNGYPANMNLDTGCQLKTAMCCFSEGDFPGNGDAVTDVCHHDLANSPYTNHIKRGTSWSAMPGTEADVHCTGFTWKEGEEDLLGNMMYDVSLRNTVNKGYKRGVPGAPMCGCIEHMPVVERASCRTAAKTGDATYTFTYVSAAGGGAARLTASSSAPIVYGDCADGRDLKAAYKAKFRGGDAEADLIDEHLVDDCGAENEGYLNDHFMVAGASDRYTMPDPDKWQDGIEGAGIYHQPPGIDLDKADQAFRALVDGGCTDAEGGKRHCIVRRHCASCMPSHRDIFYRRLTALPSTGTDDPVNFLRLFVDTWRKGTYNVNKVDFTLHSTYEDALAGTNAWNYCNYDDTNIGFPRDCGPSHGVGGNWNSIRRGMHHAKHHGFYVEKPGAAAVDDSAK